MDAAAPFKVGDRIVLIDMPRDPDPIKPGEKGTVTFVTSLYSNENSGGWQIGVDWDNGRMLALAIPPDIAKVLEK